MDTQKTILVAEDDDTLRKMLGIVFEDEGYEVDFAVDGQQAWELIQQAEYDLLVTDLFMPRLNGIELIKRCQKMHKTMKIIMVSGGGKELVAEHMKQHIQYNGEDQYIDMFLKKPCDLSDILDAVEQVLGQ